MSNDKWESQTKTTKMKRNITVEFVKNKKKEWRWKLTAHNGNLIAWSGESYNNKSGAVKGFEAVRSAILQDRVVVEGLEVKAKKSIY